MVSTLEPCFASLHARTMVSGRVKYQLPSKAVAHGQQSFLATVGSALNVWNANAPSSLSIESSAHLRLDGSSWKRAS
eukprot:6183215-Pleurochrysis_carterae.AAC.1